MKTGAADKAATRYAEAHEGAALPRMSSLAGPTAGCTGRVGSPARQSRGPGSAARAEQLQLVAAPVGQSPRRSTTGREKAHGPQARRPTGPSATPARTAAQRARDSGRALAPPDVPAVSRGLAIAPRPGRSRADVASGAGVAHGAGAGARVPGARPHLPTLQGRDPGSDPGSHQSTLRRPTFGRGAGVHDEPDACEETCDGRRGRDRVRRPLVF